MSDYKKGMLVQHTTLGLGKIVALDHKAVHVFFANSQDRFATKLRRDLAEPFLSLASSTDRWLTGLSAFAFDERAARYRISDPWISDADAIARFVEVYPDGFRDVKYTTGDGKAGRERSLKWRRAHQAFSETLGNGEGERLLAAGDVTTIVDRACQVERHVRPLLSAAEKSLFADALSDAGVARGYFEALFELLAAPAPDETRFDALASAVATLPANETPESAWYVATVLPFVAQPDRHMILRPKITCAAAQRLRFELAYRPEPSWATYAALLQSSGDLLEKLRSLGASDHVDVEVFTHVALQKHSRPAAAVAPAPARRH
ncbi:MAG TPA: hypothetical protein VFK85_07805 [Anaeromyxobacteraceae bacterium]|nr:hypothetical protein [Anaeromyxobacteraceae bacterium]